MTDYVIITKHTKHLKGVGKNNTNTLYFMVFLNNEMVGVTGLEPVTPTMAA